MKQFVLISLLIFCSLSQSIPPENRKNWKFFRLKYQRNGGIAIPKKDLNCEGKRVAIKVLHDLPEEILKQIDDGEYPGVIYEYDDDSPSQDTNFASNEKKGFCESCCVII